MQRETTKEIDFIKNPPEFLRVPVMLHLGNKMDQLRLRKCKNYWDGYSAFCMGTLKLLGKAGF